MKEHLVRRRPLIYLITDRRMLTPRKAGHEAPGLIELIRSAAAAGIDLIQLRERDLSPRDLLAIIESVLPAAREAKASILINDRPDIAACAGVGVHLTTRSLQPDVVRRNFGDSLLIGASTHNLREAEHAAQGGADFLVFGPVFQTESKRGYGPPVGLEALREAVGRVPVPVIGLGGIKPANVLDVLGTGAAGVAAISMFTDTGDLAAVVRWIKSAKTEKT